MSNLSTNYVLTLLQSYRATKRKIEQLRYELEHPARVTPDEMIEAMNFAKGDGESRPSGSVSNKTLYIAMNFQSASDEVNAALTHDLVSRLVPLEQEIPPGVLCGTSGTAAGRGHSTRLLRGPHMAADQR